MTHVANKYVKPIVLDLPAGAHRPTQLADLATRHRHGVSKLLAERDDLRGVHAFADVVEEAVRWSA